MSIIQTPPQKNTFFRPLKIEIPSALSYWKINFSVMAFKKTIYFTLDDRRLKSPSPQIRFKCL